MPDSTLTACRSAARGVLTLLLLLTVAVRCSHAQLKASALKLPDGTVVLFSPTPDVPNPPIDGVLLSGKEYQSLLEELDRVRRQTDLPTLQVPSRCEIRGRVETTGSLPFAALSITYSFRTTVPMTVVNLGGQRGQPRAAKTRDGRLPVLSYSGDSFTALAENPGDHALTVEFETPVRTRGLSGELGFELGLPRSPVTTFTFDVPPSGKGLFVGPRGPDGTTYRPDLALGPTERLDISWEPPASTASIARREPTAESDVSVRVDENQVEVLAKIRLRGPPREWQLTLPPGADVFAERSDVGVDRPTTPAKRDWLVTVPDDPLAEWVVTAIARFPRVPSSEPNVQSSFPVGPIVIPNAAHTGTIRFFAPPTVALRFRAGPECRRQVLAPAGGEETVALFRFAAPAPRVARADSPLLTFEARPASGFLRIEPDYRLRLSPAGWVMAADLKVAPVRAEVSELRVEFPTGWQGGVEASARRSGASAGNGADAAELVDEVEVTASGDGPRHLIIRLAGPQKSPFELSLSAVHPVPAGSRETTIIFPRFLNGAVEQSAKLSAEVPPGLDVLASATARDRGSPGEPIDLRITGGANVLSATFDRGVGQIFLNWQPQRPDVTARIEVEVTLSDRQAVISESVLMRAESGSLRTTRFRGPSAATATLVAPGLRPVGDTGEWELSGGAKETATVSLSYVLPLPASAAKWDLPLVWPDSVNRTDVRVRVWGGSGVRRLAGFDGPWQLLPPEPVEGRDSLPWLTLAGASSGLKLALDFADPSEGALPGVWVDRSNVRVWTGGDVLAVHGRFFVRRWAASRVDLVVPTGIVPEVYVDGRKAENLLDAGQGALRVPIPDAKSGRAGVVVDVWYSTPTETQTVTPPILTGVAYTAPTRWQVYAPRGEIILDPWTGMRHDGNWAWRNGLYGPIPVSEPPDSTLGEAVPAWATVPQRIAPVEVLSGRQFELRPVRFFQVPRATWIAAWSMASSILVLGVSRLRPTWLGPSVAGIGVGVALLAAMRPQPTAEAAAAVQPGIWAAGVVLVGQAVLRWYHRRAVTHLPGFTRKRPEFEPQESRAELVAPGSRGESGVELFGPGSKSEGSPRGIRAGV